MALSRRHAARSLPPLLLLLLVLAAAAQPTPPMIADLVTSFDQASSDTAAAAAAAAAAEAAAEAPGQAPDEALVQVPPGLLTSGTTAPEVLARIPSWARPARQAAIVPFVPTWQATGTTLLMSPPGAGPVAVQTDVQAPPGVHAIADVPVARTEAELLAALAAYGNSTDAVSVLQTVPSQYTGIHNRHNYYRSLHGTPALTWTSTLAGSASSYASQCRWGHDPNNNGQGENLYATSDTSNPSQALMDAIAAWYNEISYYDFNNPGFSGSTGHFTQVVWKSTTQLGCAVQVCGSGFAGWSSGGTYVVCRYSPPGNVVGGTYFRDNPAAAGRAPAAPAAAGCAAAAPPPPAPVPPGTLPEGYMFQSPGCLVAWNSAYWICMQNDANMVLFNSAGRALWASGTAGYSTKTPFSVVMARDGNLNIYDAAGTWLWTTNTAGKGTAPRRFIMQGDGNALIADINNRATWATYTAGQ